MTINQNDDENDDLNDNVNDNGYGEGEDGDGDEANFDGIDDRMDYEHYKESRLIGNGNIDGNNDDPVGHGGSPIILMRKNLQNRRRQQRDKIPPLTATKKFHQLIVKSPLKVRGDTDQSEDVQLTKEGETMTFYL